MIWDCLPHKRRRRPAVIITDRQRRIAGMANDDMPPFFKAKITQRTTPPMPRFDVVLETVTIEVEDIDGATRPLPPRPDGPMKFTIEARDAEQANDLMDQLMKVMGSAFGLVRSYIAFHLTRRNAPGHWCTGVPGTVDRHAYVLGLPKSLYQELRADDEVRRMFPPAEMHVDVLGCRVTCTA